MANLLQNILLGLDDFQQSIRQPLKWIYLGYIDIFLRYKRSIIGPFWITISISVIIFVLSHLWAQILSIDFNFFVSYFSIGYILWYWLSSTVIESSSSMTEFEGLIKQIKIPISTYLLRVSLRNFLVFLHNCVLIVLVIFIFDNQVNIFEFITISLPSIFLIFISLTSLGVMISIISVRYRDLSSIISFLMQLFFFINPLIWHPDIINKSTALIEYNLFFYWIDVIRQPLLGLEVHENSLLVIFVSSIICILVSAFVIGRYKKKIIYWRLIICAHNFQ